VGGCEDFAQYSFVSAISHDTLCIPALFSCTDKTQSTKQPLPQKIITHLHQNKQQQKNKNKKQKTTIKKPRKKRRRKKSKKPKPNNSSLFPSHPNETTTTTTTTKNTLKLKCTSTFSRDCCLSWGYADIISVQSDTVCCKLPEFVVTLVSIVGLLRQKRHPQDSQN